MPQPKLAKLVLSVALAASLAACDGRREQQPAPVASPSAGPVASTPAPSAPVALTGDAARGRKLVDKYECNRCHEGTGLAAAPQEKHCTRCHEDISTGKFRAPADKLAKWKPNVAHVRETPSLASAGQRFKTEWLVAFLQNPHDLRPNLVPSMPRLKIDARDARDIAAHLLRDAGKANGTASDGDASRGRELYDQKQCGSCHAFSGSGIASSADPKAGTDEQRRAVRLAPDLRFARDRVDRGQLIAWLLDPARIKPGTLMPASGLSPQDARHLATFILTAPLAPIAKKPVPKRLPVLDRQVGFQEVMSVVLGKTCRHCHSDPDVSLGDGGPGNTGGFGFAPRKLDLASYSGVAGGLLDAHGERPSVLSQVPDGDPTPRLVAALMARWQEEAGQPNPDVRGMPLGLPPLPLEQIQLVESWIAQGRPR